ncbi:MAG: hypothetical protein H0W33_00570 [Gammaproteobacteria bacterium]|nr:hypothetical protein [Gammaproteobacteria bacterium]
MKYPTLATLAVFLLAGCATERITVSASDPHGIIDVGNAQIAKNIHPVVLQEIDGHQVPGSGFDEVPVTASTVIVNRDFLLKGQSAFYLSPGPHRLRLTAIIREDLALTLPSAKRLDDRDAAGLLTLNVAEGRRYLLGAKLDSARPDEWEPVAYAVEDISGYEFGFESD